MARSNVAAIGERRQTHEGATAMQISSVLELRRSVMAAMLWESTFYESGSDLGKRIAALVPKVSAVEVANIAIEARDKMYLRHVPLFLVRELARIKGNGTIVAKTLEHVIQRPDEMTEYLAMYWKGKASGTSKRPEPLSAGSKRGLARAFRKFKAETLAKYDRDNVVKLVDVLRLVHAGPVAKGAGTRKAFVFKQDDQRHNVWRHTEGQGAVWAKVVSRTLEAPDTWEVALSAGGKKKDVFERLLREEKLGGLAFLRNLRNMIEADVDRDLIRARFGGNFDKVLPFRFIAAAEHAMSFADEINAAMLRVTADMEKLRGRTALLVDVSGSMDHKLSAKSDLSRMGAAAALAILIREVSEDCQIFTFSDRLMEVMNYRGLALANAVVNSQPHMNTYMGKAIRDVYLQARYDRMIVISDEQSSDEVRVPPDLTGYVVNVATFQNGVGYGKWTHIDGFSERVVDFIQAVEAEAREVLPPA